MNYEKNKRNKPSHGDEVVISCHRCGHEYHYESFEILEQIPISTPCENCGFLFLKYVDYRLKMLSDLMISDPNPDEPEPKRYKLNK